MIIRGATSFISITFALAIASCNAPKQAQKPVVAVRTQTLPVDTIASSVADTEDAFFENIFKSYPGVFEKVLSERNEMNLQIIYTQINRDKNNKPALTHHYFNRRGARYFYPASTVKLPVALLALEDVSDRNKEHAMFPDKKNMSMITEAAYSGQSAVYNDPNTMDGRPTVEQYIKKIFLVSDNNAFNRLYEYLGQEAINDHLHKKGYNDAQILHRLDVFLTDDQNRHTNPVHFYDTVQYNSADGHEMLFNKKQYEKRSDYIGKGYYSNGKFIDKPMVFSGKNRISLNDLHTILQSVIFPETVPASQRFNISDVDREFVLKYMSMFPRESRYPSYDSTFNDGYAKAIMYGNDKVSLPKNIRVFDKSGVAYGQLVDVAYVIDTEHKIEFIVSAAIYCNTDGILNDDKYDYDSVGFPFMKNLGKALYNYEAGRKKNYLPDLSEFIFSYDK